MMKSNKVHSVCTKTIIPDFSKIVENNPSGIILRKNLNEATGGLLDSRTMANLDSEERGIPERIILGRKVAYPVPAVVTYLQENAVCIRHKREPQKVKKEPEPQIIQITDKC